MSIEDTLRLVLREELQRANRELLADLERLLGHSHQTTPDAETRDARWLNPVEAAQLAGVHPETVRDAMRARDLHGHQSGKGGAWRTRPECIDAWLQGEKCPHLANVLPPTPLASKQERTPQR